MIIRTCLSIFWPPLSVLGLHFLRVLVAPEAYQYDMLAHTLGGASIALVAWNIKTALIAKRHLPRLPLWFSAFLCIATAEFIGVLWEFWEFFIQDRIRYIGLTLEDTILDLLLDITGAILLTTVLVWKQSMVDSTHRNL